MTSSSQEEAVALRREWEAELQRRATDAQHRHLADLGQRDAYERVGWETRGFLTQKLVALIERLEPETDGTTGDVNASLVAVYAKALHELGALYGLQKPPRPVTPPPVLPEPEAVVSQDEERLQLRVAVEAAVAAARDQLGEVKRKMIGS